MNLSERNKKVAVARWNKILSKEKENIRNNDVSLKLKSMLSGFLAGDGSVQIRKEKEFYHYEIQFFPDDELMLSTYCSIIKKLYGKNPKITRGHNVFNARITSKTIVEDLFKYSSFGLKKWCLPYELFRIKGAKEVWLKAFFSAEAYVGSNSIKIQTVNKKGMMSVSKLLNDLGIPNKYYEYTPKNKNYSSVGIIFILSKEARKLFYDKIGFYHSKKTETLKKSLGL